MRPMAAPDSLCGKRGAPSAAYGVAFTLMALLALAALLANPTPARAAYSCTDCHFGAGQLADHDNMGKPCASCHHKWSASAPYDPHSFLSYPYALPHGNYTASSDKCLMCHMAHEASSSAQLLVGATVSATCMTCHNQTGAKGVFGRIAAKGGTVRAEHTVDVTTTIPGGSTALSQNLYCNSCHTPHDNTVMADFATDDMVSNAGYPRHKLLRDDVDDAPRGTYTEYGSAWCAACHDRRHESRATEGLYNHPVDTTTAYNDSGVATSTPDPGPTPKLGGGAANSGYIFTPAASNTAEEARVGYGRINPRPAAPICQQCHEDARDVESAVAPVNSNGYPLGNWSKVATTSMNPQYYDFPHQTSNPSFVVETGDDLCLNCHPTDFLP